MTIPHARVGRAPRIIDAAAGFGTEASRRDCVLFAGNQFVQFDWTGQVHNHGTMTDYLEKVCKIPAGKLATDLTSGVDAVIETSYCGNYNTTCVRGDRVADFSWNGTVHWDTTVRELLTNRCKLRLDSLNADYTTAIDAALGYTTAAYTWETVLFKQGKYVYFRWDGTVLEHGSIEDFLIARKIDPRGLVADYRSGFDAVMGFLVAGVRETVLFKGYRYTHFTWNGTVLSDGLLANFYRRCGVDGKLPAVFTGERAATFV